MTAATSATPGIRVEPVPSLGDEVNDVRARTAAIVNELVLPNERLLLAGEGIAPGVAPPDHGQAADAAELRAGIIERVKQDGLWAPHLPRDYGGMGLDVVAHACMNEVLAYSLASAPLFGVVAPNAGNQELLLRMGTLEQKQRWLVPLVEGDIESAFSMTEPDRAGSDPGSIATVARQEGRELVIDGHKWFTSNAERADVFVVMCRVQHQGQDEPSEDMVQVLVPAGELGIRLVRPIGLWGSGTSDHWEVRYEGVRVPVDNVIGAMGAGRQAAQVRLGAGRVFHCMTAVGQMWRAFDLMVRRAATREVRGGLLADQQFAQGAIADSYLDVQSARLMTLDAAAKVQAGDPRARIDVSAIKVFVPQAWHRVADRAIQMWGAAGFTDDLPLAATYLGARMLRVADGPDEVHRILIAKQVLAGCTEGGSWPFGR